MKTSISRKKALRFVSDCRLLFLTFCAFLISGNGFAQDLGGTAPAGAEVQPVSINFTKTGGSTVSIQKWYAGSGTNPFPGGYNYNFASTAIPTTMYTNGYTHEFLINGATFAQLTGGTVTISAEVNGTGVVVPVPTGNYSNSNVPSGYTAWMTLPTQILESQPWGKERNDVSGTSGTYAASCDWTTIGMGPGAWFNITLAANAYYDFSWENFRTSKAEIEVVAGGTGSDGDFTLLEGTNELGWYSGTTAPTIRVWAVRNNPDNSNWGDNGAKISYRLQAPELISANNPTSASICPGDPPTSISNAGTTNIGGAVLYWQGTNENGTSTANPGSPNNASSAGTYYYRAYDPVGGCWSNPQATEIVEPDVSVDAGSNATISCWEAPQLAGSINTPQGDLITIHSANFNSGWDGWTASNFVRATGFNNGGENITSGGTNFVYWCSDCSGGGTSTLTSGAMSTVGISNIRFKLRMYFRQASPSNNSRIYVEYSTNGTNWTTQDITEGITNNFRIGTYNNFATKTYNIPAAFANQPTVYFRLRYTHTSDWSWSFDDIEIYGDEVVPLTYSWSPTTGLSNPNILNPIATPATTTTYTLSATTQGCTITDNVTITVDNSINAGSDVSIACGDQTQLGFDALNPMPGGYCAASHGTVEAINRVLINTLDNSTASGANYVDLTANSTVLIPGNTYTITVWGNTAGNYTNHIRAFIDWNRDGDFADTGESIVVGSFTNSANGSASTTITVPLTASTGITRMRIRKNYDVSPTDPCGSTTYGQTKDFSLHIGNFAPGNPTAYAWSPATGLSATNVANPMASSSTTTTYTVDITYPSGCVATDDVTVTTVAITADAGSNEAIVCGDEVILAGSSNVSAPTYSWSVVSGDNNSIVSGGNTANPTVAPGDIAGASTTYQVEVSTIPGCTPATDQVTVSVSSISISANAMLSPLYCGQVTVLEGTSNAPSADYDWSVISGDFNSILSTGVASPSIRPTETTTYQLQASATGCNSPTQQVTIVVDDLFINAHSADPNDPTTITCSEYTYIGEIIDPNVLFVEDFEMNEGAFDFGGNWSRSTGTSIVPANGNYSAIISSGNNNNLTFDLPAGKDRVMNFDVLNYGEDAIVLVFYDNLTIQYYNGSWQNIGSINGINLTWSTYTASIPDDATQIRFRPTFSLLLDDHGVGVDNIVISGRPAYTYSWTPLNSYLSAYDIPVVKASPQETTNYTLEVSADGCLTLTDEIEITVIPLFDVAIDNPDYSICNNEDIITLLGSVGDVPEDPFILFEDDFQNGFGTDWIYNNTWDDFYQETANPGQLFVLIQNGNTGSFQLSEDLSDEMTNKKLTFRYKNPTECDGFLLGSICLGDMVSNPLTVQYYNGSAWATLPGGALSQQNNWTTVTLDIPNNATNIRFSAGGNTAGSILVDDILIVGNPLPPVYTWLPDDPIFFLDANYQSTLTPDVNPPGTVTYVLSAYSFGCTHKDSVKVTVCLSWTGEVDDNWFDGGNWAFGYYPEDCDDNVFIPVTATYPLVDDDVYCGDVYVVNGAEINFTPNGVMNICGDITGNGWLGSGDGVIKINGDEGPQEVSAQSLVNVGTLVMDNSNGLTNYGTTMVTNSIDLVDGTLTNDGGSVILDSDGETYSAYFDDFSEGHNGAFVGDLTAHVSLYSSMASAVKNKKKGYRQMSSPVISTVGASLSHLAFGPSGYYAGNATLTQQNFPTIWIYRETHQMDFNYNWYSYTGASNLLNPMMGVNVRVKEPTLANLQVDFVGVPHSGSYSTPLTNSNGDPQGKGWNFIGNPYPSPIDWSSVDKGTSDGNAYLFHTEGEYAGTYATVNSQGVGTNNATGKFAIGQGFLVYTTQASGSISMTNENRMADNSALFYGKPNLQPNELRLKLTNGETSDEIVNYTNGGASADIDEGFDARKVPVKGDIYLAYALNDDNFSINVMDALEEATVLPLIISVNKTGIYELQVEQQNIVGLTPYLKNKKTGDLTRLDTEIPVMLSLEGDEVYDNYEVVFKNGSSSTIEDAISNTIQIFANDNEVHIKRSNDGNANITITNLLGQTVVSTETTEQDLTFTLDASQANWVAVVKVQEKDQVKTVKVLIRK